MSREDPPGLLRSGTDGADAASRRRTLVSWGKPWISPGPLPLRALLPRSTLHWASALLLWAGFLAYLVVWIRGNGEMLWDPLVQADDVRTYLFPFHRYGDGILADDPLASDMALYTPPLLRALYLVLVPWTGLQAAAKIVQGLGFVLLPVAGWTLLRARRAGLAGAVLLVFLFLHTPFCVNRIAGGLPRSFAFPAIALWLAGALGGRGGVRVAGVLLAAATYPVAMLILLAAEGTLVLRSGLRPTPALRGRLVRAALLAVACTAVVGGFLLGEGRGDRVHTAAEARREPAFGAQGRLSLFPLDDGGATLLNAMTSPFVATRFLGKDGPVVSALATAAPLAAFAFLLLLFWTRSSPVPVAAGALSIGTIAVYLLAIAFAFRLYAPDRYASYGGTAVGLALPLYGIGLLAPKMRSPRRATARNLAALAFLGVVCLLGGDGVVPRNGVDLDGRTQASLYDFARGLPDQSKIAAHPLDGDELPFWAGSATVASYETLQPWYVDSWGRQKRRTMSLLRALYATDPDTVLRFATAEGVTHLLLRPDRYRQDFLSRARLFQPFDSFTARLLANVSRRDLVLARIPADAIVFRGSGFVVVDVARLRASWRGTS